MASAISYRDSVNAKSEAHTAILSKLIAEHNDREGHRGKTVAITQNTMSMAETTALCLEEHKVNADDAKAKEGKSNHLRAIPSENPRECFGSVCAA